MQIASAQVLIGHPMWQWTDVVAETNRRWNRMENREMRTEGPRQLRGLSHVWHCLGMGICNED
jgi:hypothetical protein